MRAILAIVFFVALAASEYCDDDADDCKSFYCQGSSQKRCVNHVCTCVSMCGDYAEKCESKRQCTHEALKHHCQCDTEYHCIDRYCHCGFPAAQTTAAPTAAPTTEAPTTQAPNTAPQDTQPLTS